MIDQSINQKYFWTQAYILCRFHHGHVENANIKYHSYVFNYIVHYTTLLRVEYFYLII
jgi:hypothetical protein